MLWKSLTVSSHFHINKNFTYTKQTVHGLSKESLNIYNWVKYSVNSLVFKEFWSRGYIRKSPLITSWFGLASWFFSFVSCILAPRVGCLSVFPGVSVPCLYKGPVSDVSLGPLVGLTPPLNKVLYFLNYRISHKYVDLPQTPN